MMRLQRFAEPDDFDDKVRQKGIKFLTNTPLPSSKQWGSHSYWTDVKGTLYDLYDGICSYCCTWISPKGNEHVDHYVPKSKNPSLAYEWSNYRLSSGRINGIKREFDVLDPFEIKDGWFAIDFDTLKVKAGDDAPDHMRQAVESSIERLKLNDLNTTIKDRQHWLNLYIKKKDSTALEILQRHAPFIAAELKRQKLEEEIKNRPLWP